MAANYTCAVEICRDFAGQCELRIDDLEFDLACSKLALEFWSEAPGHAKPVVDAIRQLAAERGRHAAALTDLRERLAALSQNEAIHHHLELPLTHYEKLVRQRLFPDPKPTAGPELRGFR